MSFIFESTHNIKRRKNPLIISLEIITLNSFDIFLLTNTQCSVFLNGYGHIVQSIVIFFLLSMPN